MLHEEKKDEVDVKMLQGENQIKFDKDDEEFKREQQRQENLRREEEIKREYKTPYAFTGNYDQ